MVVADAREPTIGEPSRDVCVATAVFTEPVHDQHRAAACLAGPAVQGEAATVARGEEVGVGGHGQDVGLEE